MSIGYFHLCMILIKENLILLVNFEDNAYKHLIEPKKMV